ncbi:hypothetical protein [uncultured Cellulomonas sp.]|nr:hypothetical protein [uncultured Cellulomonas sp.]
MKKLSIVLVVALTAFAGVTSASASVAAPQLSASPCCKTGF